MSFSEFRFIIKKKEEKNLFWRNTRNMSNNKKFEEQQGFIDKM